MWEGEQAVDLTPLSVLNRFRTCIQTLCSLYLQFLCFSYMPTCPDGRCMLFEDVLFEDLTKEKDSGLSQVNWELLLGSVCMISVAQCPALLLVVKCKCSFLHPVCQNSSAQSTRRIPGNSGCSKHVHILSYLILFCLSILTYGSRLYFLYVFLSFLFVFVSKQLILRIVKMYSLHKDLK